MNRLFVCPGADSVECVEFLRENLKDIMPKCKTKVQFIKKINKKQKNDFKKLGIKDLPAMVLNPSLGAPKSVVHGKEEIIGTFIAISQMPNQGKQRDIIESFEEEDFENFALHELNRQMKSDNPDDADEGNDMNDVFRRDMEKENQKRNQRNNHAQEEQRYGRTQMEQRLEERDNDNDNNRLERPQKRQSGQGRPKAKLDLSQKDAIPAQNDILLEKLGLDDSYDDDDFGYDV